MKINIREANISDRDKICKLLTENTPYKRDRAFWVWINKVIYNSNSIITIAEINDEIIAHYAILPNKIYCNEQIINSGLGIHAFVHPEYRGKVFIYKISELAYNIAKERDIKIIYGFPNVNYRQIQIQIEGWNEINTFYSKDIKLNNVNVSVNENVKLLKAENTFDNQFIIDSLIDNNSTYQTHIEKNLNYYVNRYINHPQNLYDCFLISKNDKIVGFVVYKIFENQKGHIIDFIKTNEISYDEILDISINYFKNKVSILSLWNINSEFSNSINRYKVENGFETFFGAKFLDNTITKEIINFTNWNLHMGDSDAF